MRMISVRCVRGWIIRILWCIGKRWRVWRTRKNRRRCFLSVFLVFFLVVVCIVEGMISVLYCIYFLVCSECIYLLLLMLFVV